MNIVSLNSSQNSFYISKYWKNHSKISSFSLILGTKNLAEHWDQTGGWVGDQLLIIKLTSAQLSFAAAGTWLSLAISYTDKNTKLTN